MSAPQPREDETPLINQCLLALSQLPECMVWRNNTGLFKTLDGKRTVRAGVTGSADILGVYRFAPLAVECKTPNDTQRTKQKNFQARYTQCGGIYLIARDHQKIQEQLQKAHHEWTHRQR